MTAPAVLVEVQRSGLVESVHRGHVVVVDEAGAVVLSAGDPDALIYPRSAVKPVQALAMREAGLAYEGPELALTAASHSGEPFQRRHVEQMLAAADLDESMLQCPVDLPYGEQARADYLAAGHAPSRVAMNCSGKHAGMLATCRTRDWSVHDYLDPSHPLQRDIRAVVEEMAGTPVSRVSVDGCGAPLFALPLVALARAFVGIPGRDPQVVAAFQDHPDYAAGPDRDLTAALRGVPGLLAKDGAESVQAMVVEHEGATFGIALKISDGAQRARPVVAAATLAALGVVHPVVTEQMRAPVLGGGRPVGEVRPAPGWFGG